MFDIFTLSEGLNLNEVSTLAAMVAVITEVLKNIVPQKFPTKGLALIVSILVVYGYLIIGGDITTSKMTFGAFESFVVSFISMFGYDTFKDIGGKFTKHDGDING